MLGRILRTHLGSAGKKILINRDGFWDHGNRREKWGEWEGLQDMCVCQSSAITSLRSLMVECKIQQSSILRVHLSCMDI